MLSAAHTPMPRCLQPGFDNRNFSEVFGLQQLPLALAVLLPTAEPLDLIQGHNRMCFAVAISDFSVRLKCALQATDRIRVFLQGGQCHGIYLECGALCCGLPILRWRRAASLA